MKATTSSDPPRPLIIKRYANRKLYDTSARRYVTLEDVATLVARGEDLEVTDQATGEDLTTLVLAQVLLDGVRQRTARIPRQVLARLIRIAGGPRSDWEDWPEPRDAAGRAGHEAEKIAGRFLAGGRPSLEDAVVLREEIGQLVHRLVDEAQSGLETRLRGLLTLGEGAAGRSLGVIRSGLHVFDGRAKAPATRKKSSSPKRASRGRGARIGGVPMPAQKKAPAKKRTTTRRSTRKVQPTARKKATRRLDRVARDAQNTALRTEKRAKKTVRKAESQIKKETKALQSNLVTAERRAEKELTALAERLGIDTREVSRYLKQWNRALDKELKTASRQIDTGIDQVQKLVRKERTAAGKMLDDAVQRALAALNIPSRQEIQTLTRKVAQLSRKIDKLES